MTRYGPAELEAFSNLVPGMERILHLSEARGLPDPCPDGVPCCDGYAYLGYEHCLCWEPLYDLEQSAELQTDVEPDEQARMCSNCAFRPGSPERTDDPDAVAGSGDLWRIVLSTTERFWCHDGMRQGIGWRHPNGMTHLRPADAAVQAFQPPIIDGVPYRADGRPGLICAGLMAARRAKDWTP